VASNNSFVYPIYVPNFRALDHGPADFDHRNVISASFVYTEPKVLSAVPAVGRYLLNGWEMTGIVQFRSGDPLTVFSSTANNSGSGQQRDRAVLEGNPNGGAACKAGTHCKSYLNPASFANNAPGTYGDTTKGEFVGPQYGDWDASLARRFPITEGSYFQFRAEYFNLLNHTNFGDPGTTAATSSFGQITSTAPQNSNYTNDPRIAQMSLKLVF
jgi:hypothetical protein